MENVLLDHQTEIYRHIASIRVSEPYEFTVGGYTFIFAGAGLYRYAFRIKEQPSYIVKFSKGFGHEKKEAHGCNMQEWQAWEKFNKVGLGDYVAKVYSYIPLDEKNHRSAIIVKDHGKTVSDMWADKYRTPERNSWEWVNENGETAGQYARNLAWKFLEKLKVIAPDLLDEFNLTDFHAGNVAEDGVIIDYGGAA